MDFEKVDAILQPLKDTMIDIAQKKNLEGETDMWRNDFPDICFVWNTKDGISRSVVLCLKPIDSSNLTEIYIEINAWQDKGKERQWINIPIGTIVYGSSQVLINWKLHTAFNTAILLTKEDLPLESTL